MAAVNIGDKILITFSGSLFAQRILNTFWYQVSALTGTPNTTSFGTALNTAITGAATLKTAFLDCCPDNYNLDQTWIQFIDPVRVVKSVFNDNLPGTWGADTDTANVAGVITRRGNLAGRKRVGSLHVPISSDPTAITDGILVPGLLARMATLASELPIALGVGSLGQVNPILRNGPLTTDVTLIDSAFTHNEVRTMRRRTLGRGI